MSAKRAYSDEGPHSPDRYSDDFVSDDDKKTHKETRVLTPKKNPSHHYYQDKVHMQKRGSGSLRGQVQGRGLRKGRGYSGASEPDMKKHNDSITTRVLSASRNRISELRNKIEELKIKIRDLEQENKLYKTLQFRHEKAIRTFSDKENDLPLILDKHNNEIRALKEQNRRLREKYEKSDRYLRDAEDELEKVKKKMSKYKEICEEKELIERDELTRRLAKVEQEVEEKETKIKELQKHIEVIRKSHRHEMGIEAARQKDVKKQLEVLKEKNLQLESLIKEKEKALDYQNIHSNPRQGRSPRNNSPGGGNLARKSKRKTASTTELITVDKAKYSEKQRTEVCKQKELKEEQERKKKQKWEEEKKENVLPRSPPEISYSSISRTLEDMDESTRWGEDEQINKSNLEKREEENLQKPNGHHNVDSTVKHDEEKEEKDESETREQWELQELKARKIMETEERKRKEKERREIKEKLKLDIKEEAQEEGKQLPQIENLENDLILQADRKKKDDLLKKLKILDEVGSAVVTDPFSQAFLKNKDQTHEKGGLNEFTRSTNNIHNSKSSKKDAAKPTLEYQKNKRQTSGDGAEGYQPSFGPTRGNTNKLSNKPTSAFDDDEPVFKITNDISSNMTTLQENKKPNLLESLFGSKTNSSKFASTKNVDDNETFLTMNKNPSSNNQTTGTKEETKSGSMTSNKSTFYSDKKSTTFGGDTSVIDSDLLGSSGKVSSHRQRHQIQKMSSVKPSLIDNFDDEIEEVTL